MWWDDYTAFMLLVVDVMYIILMWLRFRYGGKHTRFMPKQLCDKCFLAAGITTAKVEGFVYSAWLGEAIGWTVIW
jgi:hypothetical protein